MKNLLLLLSIYTLLFYYNATFAQSVYTCTSAAYVRSGACTTYHSYGVVNPAQSFVVIGSSITGCGYTWYQVDVPNEYLVSSEIAYVASVNFSPSGTPTNYLIVQPSAAPGLLIFNNPGGAAGDEVWMYDVTISAVYNWASFNAGQYLARTPTPPQTIGLETWYQVYLTPDCYTGDLGSSPVALTGWVGDGVGTGSGAPYVLPYTSGCAAVTVTSSPSNQTVTAGNSATFSVSVSGTPPFSYFWYSNIGLVGSTVGSSSSTNSYTTPSLSTSDNGDYYYCKVTNCSSTDEQNSSNAYVTVNASCTGPAAPAAFSSSVTPTSFIANWGSVSGATGYDLEVSANSSFSSFVYSSYVGNVLTYPVTGLTCNTPYYYRVKATNGACYGNYSPTVTVASGACCTPPASPTVQPATMATSSSFQANWSSVSGATDYYIDVATDAGFTSMVTGYNNQPTSGATFLNVTGLTCSTTYYYRVRSTTGTCASGSVGSMSVTTGACVTITVNSIDEIDPWQRAGDNYTVQINATTSDGAMWKIVAHDPSTANPDQSSPLNSSGSTITLTPNFASPTPTIQYYVQSSTGAIQNLGATRTTQIIDSKWVNKNELLYNYTSQSIQIPMLYISAGIAAKVTITRSPDYVSTSNENIQPNSGSTFPMNNYGSMYYTIPIDATNNLSTIAPGDFDFLLEYYNSSGLINFETGHFDLTKFGRVINQTNSSTKIAIAVGGIYNTMDNDVVNLRNNYDYSSSSTGSGSATSNLTFSIMTYLENNGFNTWYIAQGNTNSIARNAYDVGKAIDAIINTSSNSMSIVPTEIDMITHSKGGLDTRGFLENYTQSYDNTHYYGLVNASWGGLIKKVVFLGTPHFGANLANLGTLLSDVGVTWIGPFLVKCPAVLDLRLGDSWAGTSYNLNMLNTIPLPTPIKYCNLTGYRSYYISDERGVNIDSYFNEDDDGAVPIKSSDGIYMPDGTQLYQNSPLAMSHLAENSSNYLYSEDGYHNGLNCLSTYPNNLLKILDFLNDIIIPSCSEPSMAPIQIQGVGSIISGATISVKPSYDTIFHEVGLTNEEGFFLGNFIPPLQLNDSVLINASGYEPLTIAVDFNTITTGKIVVSMLKSSTPTNKVQYAALQLVNQNPITSNSTINIGASGQNILSYQINSPFNQDTSFVPLTLAGGMFTASLDTGYNQIFVRFIGASDTVTLSKGVYYLPGSLMSQYAYNVAVNCDASSLATNVYINNQFVKQINALHDTIPVPIGQNTIKFTKFGYVDSLITVDSATAINISLQLVPFSYSSPTDSSIIDFPAQGAIQYRKNVTVMDTAQLSIMSLKQYDDNFPSKGLIAKCRKFEMLHLNTNWSNIRFAAVLDQIENLSEDSTYLMKIDNDTLFTKIAFDSIANIAAYDSVVQKLTFNYINFDSGVATKEDLVIMKKLPPQMNSVPTISINENDSLIIPLSAFYTDPDSLHDIAYSLASSSPTGLHLFIRNGELLIHTDSCYSGNTSFSLSATHDWFTRNTVMNVAVVALSHPTITASGPTTLCSGESVILTGHGVSNYQWLRDNVPASGYTDSVITVSVAGYYSVISHNNVDCYDTSNRIEVTVVATLTPTVTLSISPGTNIAPGESVTIMATVINGGSSPTYKWYINDILIPAATLPSFFCNGFVNHDTVTCIVTTGGACGESSQSSATITVSDNGAQSITTKEKLMILPNPNNGAFSIDLLSKTGEAVTVTITNLTGEIVKEFTTASNTVVDVTLNLPSGIYILSAATADSKYVAKIAVE